MLARKEGWLLVGLVMSLVLAGGALMFWQDWQRSHFNCQGRMEVFMPESRADINLRYIFNGDKGVIILRGIVTPDKGESQAINRNVWFSFTRKGNDFFLRSQSVTSNLQGNAISAEDAPLLPMFNQQGGEPYYLGIVRMDGDSRLLFTNRVPSMLYQA